MSDFLNDLWHDLRAKRLWPIAAALLVGLVAVPLLVLKPSAAPAPASPQAAAAGAQPATAGQLKVATAANAEASDLEAFKGKDPFRSPAIARKVMKAISASPGIVPIDKTPTSKPSGGSGGDSTPKSSAPTASPKAPAFTAPNLKTKTKTVRYTYVVDVTFGKNGQLRRYRGLRRLSMLPSEEAPLLISLGVDAKADDAVFIVDASVKSEGEGKCAPSGPACALLYLGAGSEQYFTRADGESYTLRVDAIRKVRLSKASKASKASRAKRSARSSSKRRILPPILNDLEIVATSAQSGSRPASHSR